MSVALSMAIANPILRSAQSSLHCVHSFIVQTQHNLYNLFSKCVLEPLEERARSSRNTQRTANCLKEYEKLISAEHSEESPILYCCPASKTPEMVVEELFSNENAFSVLKELQPDIEDKAVRELFKRGLQEYLERGMCYGESLVILKISNYFPFSGPLRKDILFESYAPIIAFLQAIGVLQEKWSAIQAIKEAVAKEGYSVDRLFSDEGTIKEAELFYYLSVAFPEMSKGGLRLLMKCILKEDFFFSPTELSQKIQSLSQIERDFMNSSRKHSNLPPIPKGKWQQRHKIALLHKKEKNFVNKAVSIATKYFQNRSGSFVVSVWSEYDAHAVFVKKEKESLLYYDPNMKAWLLFSKATKVLGPILRSVAAITDPRESLEISVDTISSVTADKP